MGISRSDFVIHRTAASLGAHDGEPETHSAAHPSRRAGNEAHAAAHRQIESRAASHEILMAAGLGELGALVRGIFSPEALGIAAVMDALRELNKYIEETKQNILDATKAQADAASRAGSGGVAAGVAGAPTPLDASAPAAEDARVFDKAATNGESARQGVTAGDVTRNARENSIRMETERAVERLTDPATGAEGVNGGRGIADFDRRISAARQRGGAAASAGQGEMRALLEQAVGIMEALVEQPPTARLEDLKRRVAILEQRINADRSNARS